MTMRIMPLAVLAATLAGCATTPAQEARAQAEDARVDAKLGKALAGFQAGEPRGCINPGRRDVRIFGDRLLYRDTGNRVYLNQTTGGCFGLKREDIIVTRSFSGQLCRGDIVRTVDRTSGFPSGSCAFGDFVPYTRARQ